jgi:peptidoglycan/xylan/chitin deacetylase (PgdA/CDA1 family)
MFKKVNGIILIFVISFFFVGCTVQKNNEPIEVVEKVSTVEDNIIFDYVTSTFKLPILLYHHIGSPPDNISKNSYDWYVSQEKFEKDLLEIQNQGYETYFLSEIIDYLEDNKIPNNALIISFDDGAEDFYSQAYSILKKYNLKSSINLMTGVGGKNYLNKEQILELDKDGLVEFQSHTVYHAYLTRSESEEKIKEITKSRDDINKLLGKPAVVLAYPFGLYDDDVIDIAKEAGYKMGHTIKSGILHDLNNLFEMKRNIITENTNIKKIIGN